jgi:hypothetical protein
VVYEVTPRRASRRPCIPIPAAWCISLSDAKAKFIFPDGKTQIVEGKKGQVMWHDHPAHAVEDVANHEAPVLIVELKH